MALFKNGRWVTEMQMTPAQQALSRYVKSEEALHKGFNFGVGNRDLAMVDHTDQYWSVYEVNGHWVDIYLSDHPHKVWDGDNSYVYQVANLGLANPGPYRFQNLILHAIRTGVDGNEFLIVLDQTKQVPCTRSQSWNEEIFELVRGVQRRQLLNEAQRALACLKL